MSETLRRFREDESGPELIEWAVMVVILLVATTMLMIVLREKMIEVFVSIFNTMQKPPIEDYGP